MSRYNYKILYYWDDGLIDLYVHYIVEDTESNLTANAVDYYNTSDLDCDFYTSSDEEIRKSLKKLVEQNNGEEFEYTKVSELSPLLQYIYDYVRDSDADMCHINYDDWEELKEDNEFFEEDITKLQKEIEKYSLDDYITIDDGEYKICGYGGLQCCFNDDREKVSDELER